MNVATDTAASTTRRDASVRWTGSRRNNVKGVNSAKGRVDAPILVIQEYPLSDRMTAWFWRTLLTSGIQKTDVRLVYMLDEAPMGANRKPTKAQLKAATERFEREVRESTAKVVVPMGSDALFALTGIKENIFDTRGFIIRKDIFRSMPMKVRKIVGEYKRASKTTGAKAGDPKWANVTEEGYGVLGPDWDGVVIPAYSCDYIRLEAFAVKPAFKEDMRRVARAAKGELCEVGSNFSYWISQHEQRSPDGSVELTKQSFEQTLKSDVIAVDIETHGVNNEVIETVQFSDGTATGCFEWTEEVRQMTERIFARPGCIFVVHNSTFDIPRLLLNGVHIAQEVIDRQVYDSMFGAVVLQPDLHKGLGRCATVYLDVTPWKWKSLKDAKPELYAAKDALVTNWLGRIQMVTLKSLGMWKLCMGVDGHPGPGVMATLPELEAMTAGGLVLDRAAAEVWLAKLSKQQLRYVKLWTRMFPDVSPHANPQVSKLLYGTWGLPVQRNKHSEAISVDELALITLQAFVKSQKSPTRPDLEWANFDGEWKYDDRCTPRLFDLLLKIRSVSKLLSTYVLPTVESMEAKVHPRYIPVSKDDDRGERKYDSRGNTATGRLASYGPNIQNQPKECPYGCKGKCKHFRVRSLYVPDHPDWCFIQADYKSAELYVLAGMSGDERLLADLAGDMHQLNADRLGIDRKPAKNVTYASQYLASPSQQSDMILRQAHLYVSPAECSRIANGIWSNYAKAQAYKLHLVHLCDTQHKIINPFGRVRHFHDGRATAAVNFIPQSIVADILWCVLKPVAEVARAHGGRMVTTVHDSILVAVPKDNVIACARAIKATMERRFDCVRPGFYIPVDLEVGDPGASWVNLHKLEVAA